MLKLEHGNTTFTEDQMTWLQARLPELVSVSPTLVTVG